MQTLEQLIADPDTTVQDIFRASDNVGEIVDAAAVVRADFAQATDVVEAALDACQGAIDRFQAAAGAADESEPTAEVLAAMERARAAMAAARAAQCRYRPWAIALDKLDKWIQLQQIIQSN